MQPPSHVKCLLFFITVVELMLSITHLSENSTWGDRWEDDIESVNGSFASPVTRSLVEDHTVGQGGIKKGNENALSGLMTTYGKKDKFVHWSDNEVRDRFGRKAVL
jgi:hypothetical protein